ncbi:MAG: hypothetical protein WKF73_04265 [Nocardioidaceae bacterium]
MSLLHEDATQNMPPYEMWLQGRGEHRRLDAGAGARLLGARGCCRLVANGAPAFAHYKPSGSGGRHEPWALQVARSVRRAVVGITSFLDTRLFALLGLPPHPDD